MAKYVIRRLNVLRKAEINELYSLPSFNHSDREEFFSMDESVKKFTYRLNKFEAKVYFVLLLGYFRAKPLIYDFSASEVTEDLEYVLNKYFNGKQLKQFKLSQQFKIRLMNRLLEHLGFIRYKPGKHKAELIKRLTHTAKIQIDPRYILDDCISYFSQNRIVLPGYTTILDLITNVIISERKRINKIFNISLPDGTKSTLLGILNSKDKFTELSKLKKPSNDFSVSEIKREIKTHQRIHSFYPDLQAIIKKLNLSPANLEYYASMVRMKSVYALKRHDDNQTILYLISYLFFRYQDASDNLITALVYLSRKLHESSKKYAKKKVLEDINIIKKELKAAGELLQIYIDADIGNDISFGTIRKKAYKVLSKKKIEILSNHLRDSNYDTHHYEWDYIDQNITQVSKTIRSIFLVLDLEYNHISKELAVAFDQAKNELQEHRNIKTINLDLINKNEQKFIEGHENSSCRFEYYLYRRIYQLYSKNSITVKNSIKNKSLSSDLINRDSWKNEKESIIKNTNQAAISTPISQTLESKLNQLETKLRSFSNTIAIGGNKYVEYLPGKQQFKWSIPNKRWQESIDNPIYKQIQHLGIVELMSYVAQSTNYLDAFEHATMSKVKDDLLNNDLIACILGNGTNYGLYKMANISDRSIGRLRHVEETFLRAATLKDANDKISNAIAELPIFSYYNINDRDLFSSIDGQNFECRINTYKARFSAKNFFKGKALTSLSLVSNWVPVNAMISGSNEYEGHFGFDLLFNNTSEIQPNVLSTDTHGTNNVNFAILDFFGYQFAPRYARVKKIFFDLFVVDEDADSRPIIKLKNEINESLITSEWDNIQHILCSLSEKTASQSTIVRKLSAGKNRTLSALREYDRLIKALYILEFVDSNELRHYVQQALNRGEAYHQLRRAIASVNGNKFRGGNDYQVALWNDCARLISNCIIYYNSALLSTFLKMSQDQNKLELVKYIAQLSPVAWQHINLNGEYSFKQSNGTINFEKLLGQIVL